MRIDLPDGMWADVKDVADLREGDRKAARKALDVNTDDDGNAIFNTGMTDAMYDAVYKQVVVAWSFEGRPIPAELPGSLDTLTIPQARKLKQGCAEHYELIWGDDEDPTDDSTS